MGDAFFTVDGERFVPSLWTRGPWDPKAQHAGPAAALVGRAVEALEPIGELQVTRFTLEVLRPLPLRPLTIRAEAVRTGRRVQLCTASVSDDEGEVARAAAWRIRPADAPVPSVALEPTPVPGPADVPAAPAFDPWGGPSYFSGMEWRVARGGFVEPGPAAVWMRMRLPLVEAEEPSALSRVLVAADSGNGISMVLPIDRFLFVNTELTVHLVRMPRGQWVCLDALTRVDSGGIGLAESVLWDEESRIGRGAQSLLVAPR